ncbi:MAG: tol-pal system protein YbgF [Nitrospirota bacterium]|nr:tol-pal system protein YbgF [Nitrospirota bacterium]
MKKICSLFIVLLMSACVSGNDFDRVRRDLHELQLSNNEARKEIDSLKEKTTGVVKEDSFTAIKESQADLFARVNTTSSGLQELRGRFDENRYFTEKALKEFASEKDLLKAQIAGLETQIKAMKDKLTALESQGRTKVPAQDAAEASPSPADSVKTSPASSDVRIEQAADSKTKAYDAAYQLFKDKKFKESREGFEAFLREYPKTDLTDNAQFWIAESYYNEKDFESAILSYETLIKKYPDSDKASSGMLKQGLSFVEIGDAKTGKIILNRLIEKYPNTKDAEAAKKKIAELDKKPQKKK